MQDNLCNCRNDLCRKLLVSVFAACLSGSLIGVLCYVVASSDHSGWRTAGASLLAAIAAFLAGGLLGLIFGIPRIPQPAPVSTPATSDPIARENNSLRARYQDNTSLEKISDWLTTLLVGAGLTQITSIPRFFTKVATYLGPAMGDSPGREVYALALTLASLLLGFFTFYLLSRICLAAILPSVYLEQLAATVNAGISFSEGEGPQAIVKPQAAMDARQLRAVPMDQLQSANELSAWAKAHAAVGNLSGAEAGYREALQLDPRNVDLAFELAEVLLAKEEYEDAINMLQRAASNIDSQSSSAKARFIQRELLYGNLFLPAPHGFENAIRIGEQYVKDDPSHPRAWALLACAYGQQFSWQQQQRASAPDLAATRANVLRCVREVDKLGSSNWMNALRRAWQGVSPDENDLVAFKNDSEFAALFSPARG